MSRLDSINYKLVNGFMQLTSCKQRATTGGGSRSAPKHGADSVVWSSTSTGTRSIPGLPSCPLALVQCHSWSPQRSVITADRSQSWSWRLSQGAVLDPLQPLNMADARHWSGSLILWTFDCKLIYLDGKWEWLELTGGWERLSYQPQELSGTFINNKKNFVRLDTPPLRVCPQEEEDAFIPYASVTRQVLKRSHRRQFPNRILKQAGMLTRRTE